MKNNLALFISILLCFTVIVTCGKQHDRYTYENESKNKTIQTDNLNQTSTNDNKVQIDWIFNPTSFNITSHFAIGNKLAILSGTNEEGMSRLFALDIDDGEWLWRKELDMQVISSFCIAGDRLFFGTGYESPMGLGDGLFYCLDITNGEIIWSAKLLETSYSSPIHIDGIIYTISSSMNKDYSILYAISSYDGKVLWERKINGTGLYSPVYNNNMVYLSTDESVYCFDKEGYKVWSYKSRDGKLSGSPSVKDGRIYILSENGVLTCLESILGQEKWSKGYVKTKEEKFSHSVFIDKTRLYINSNHRLISLDCISGDVLQEYESQFKDNDNNLVLVYDDKAYFFTGKHLQVIDTLSDKMLFEYNLQGEIRKYPIIHKSNAYIIERYLHENRLVKLNLSRDVIEQGINVYPFDYPMKTSNTNMEIYNAYEYDYKHEEVINSDQQIYNTGDFIWKKDNDFETITEPVIHDGRLFMISDKSTLHAISLLNGNELWCKKINGLFEVPPIVYKDKLYIINNIGQLFKINPIHGYIESETWIGSSNNVTEVDIGFYQNNLLISNFDKELDIYNIKTHSIYFSLDLDYKILINPLVNDGLIYIIDYGGYLTVYDINNEHVKYRQLIGGSDFQPCINKKYIFINTDDGEFLQLDKANGRIINNFSDGYNIHKPPIIRHDMVLIRTGYGIYGFLVDDISKPLWTYKSQNPQTDFGLLDNDSLWISNDKGIAFIDIQSAEVIWEQNKANIERIWNPGLSQSLIIQTEEDNLYSLDYVYNKIKWSIHGLVSNIQYEPIIYDKRILFCGKDVRTYYIGD